MDQEPSLSVEKLREFAHLRGLQLSEDLCQKLLPLVNDLLVLARTLAYSEIWRSQSGDPLLHSSRKDHS